MSSDLRDLHELFDVQENQEIPPMLLEKLELQNIVEAWNTLADFGKLDLVSLDCWYCR